jgi:phospholipase/lecithinase/hemolysin
MRNLTLLSSCLALSLLLGASYGGERLVVFGDSLSDDGNSFFLSGGALPPGPSSSPKGDYGETFDESGEVFLGRFTDGRNWVDYFPADAGRFGVQISAVSAYFQDQTNDNATDFAVGGATSGAHNGLNPALKSFPDEITAYLGSLGTNSRPSEDLCVIWIGANDFSAGINPFQTVSNIKDQIARLSGAGVKNFVAITIPDISLTPQVKAQGTEAQRTEAVFAAKQFVFTANLDMQVELPRFAMQHQINITVVEINAIFYPIVFEPALFGFTNSVDLAYVPLYGPLLVSDPDDYVFWDGFHPTTKAHAIAADFVSKAIFAPLPFHQFLSLR